MKTRFGTAVATVMHLIAYAVVGPLLITTYLSLISTGLSLVLAFGIGLLFLALAALQMFATSWWESARISGLLGVDLAPPQLRESTRTDGWKLPMTLVLQFADPRNWRGMAMQAITTLLGSIAMLGLLLVPLGGGTIVAAALAPGETMPVPWADDVARPLIILLGAALVLVGAGLVVASVPIHTAVARWLMIPSREQELAEQARIAWDRRADAIRGAELERTRLERDLHDGVQPRLVSVGMTLGLAKQQLRTDPEAAAALIDEAHASTKAAITELRQLARGFQPAVLEDRGLDAALSALATQSHVPVSLDVDLPGRYPREVESAVYFAIAEAITNAVKHARAPRIRVRAESRSNGSLWARVEDDGVGGAQIQRGGGLDGVAQRIAAAGGTLSLTSPVGGPTTLEVSVPCAY